MTAVIVELASFPCCFCWRPRDSPLPNNPIICWLQKETRRTLLLLFNFGIIHNNEILVAWWTGIRWWWFSLTKMRQNNPVIMITIPMVFLCFKSMLKIITLGRRWLLLNAGKWGEEVASSAVASSFLCFSSGSADAVESSFIKNKQAINNHAMKQIRRL